MLMRIRMQQQQSSSSSSSSISDYIGIGYGYGHGHVDVDGSRKRPKQCNCSSSSLFMHCAELEAALELQSLTSVIARQKDKTVACPALRQNRQTGSQTKRHPDRQTGWQALVRAGSAICMRSNFQGFCCAQLH